MGYDGIPMMSRPTFRCDLLSNLFAAMGTGTIMPVLAGQFARTGLQASVWLVAVLVALASAGNFCATFFAQHVGRQRQVPLVVGARIGMAAFVACLALLPAKPIAAEAFVALLATPWLLIAIILTAQASVRHSNYPAELRGRIFNRIVMVTLASMAVSAKLGGLALDHLAWGHRLTYALAAVALLLSARFYAKVRIRRERTMLRNGNDRPVSPWAGLRLLRRDRTFGLYMMWQAIFGAANLMTVPVMLLIMRDYLKVSYSKSIDALFLVPVFVAVCTAPLAGKLFDHVRITRFRGLVCTWWALCRLILFIAVASGSWPLVLVAFAVEGLGRAMGTIAFNLGHMYFTSPDRGHMYMGIQQTLAGARGLLAPFVGVALLKVPSVGLKVLLIAAAIQFIAAAGFALMRPPKSAETELDAEQGPIGRAPRNV